MLKLVYESYGYIMLKTTTSTGSYYLIKSATKNKSFWNKEISYVNLFASSESALNKLYKVLQKFPENAFYDEDDMYDIEGEDDLRNAKFAKFYITDEHGEELKEITEEVKIHLLSNRKFVMGVLEEEED
jgi:hypothetical protein